MDVAGKIWGIFVDVFYVCSSFHGDFLGEVGILLDKVQETHFEASGKFMGDGELRLECRSHIAW